MRRILCFFILVLDSFSSKEVKPHTEVASDLMWVVSNGEVVTVTCKSSDGSQEQLKLTPQHFSRQNRSGVLLSFLDVVVGALAWFNDLL
jgi:hypothetical protein